MPKELKTIMNKVDFLKPLEEKLELYFDKKAPKLPKNIKKVIVEYGPYFLIFSLLFSTGFYRLFFSPSRITFLISVILIIVALPGLFKKSLQSWQLLFYSALVYLLGRMLSFDIYGFIISSLIYFYILFQIKSYYKN